MNEPLEPLPESSPRIPLRIEHMIAAAAIALIGIITFANVVVRYLTNYSFAFTEEYSIALMVVMTLVATASAVAANQHIRITYMVDKLRPRSRQRAEFIVMILVAFMFAVVAVLSAKQVWDEYRFEVTSPGLGVPQWIYTIWLPLLSLAIIGRALGRAWRVARGR
jgi:TRAP-type C4-dicarboxylate transport system permease small subunit